MKTTVTAIVFSILGLLMAGCATSGSPAKQDLGKKGSATKGSTHDQRKQMNEESMKAIR